MRDYRGGINEGAMVTRVWKFRRAARGRKFPLPLKT